MGCDRCDRSLAALVAANNLAERASQQAADAGVIAEELLNGKQTINQCLEETKSASHQLIQSNQIKEQERTKDKARAVAESILITGAILTTVTALQAAPVSPLLAANIVIVGVGVTLVTAGIAYVAIKLHKVIAKFFNG